MSLWIEVCNGEVPRPPAPVPDIYIYIYSPSIFNIGRDLGAAAYVYVHIWCGIHGVVRYSHLGGMLYMHTAHVHVWLVASARSGSPHVQTNHQLWAISTPPPPLSYKTNEGCHDISVRPNQR